MEEYINKYSNKIQQNMSFSSATVFSSVLKLLLKHRKIKILVVFSKNTFLTIYRISVLAGPIEKLNALHLDVVCHVWSRYVDHYTVDNCLFIHLRAESCTVHKHDGKGEERTRFPRCEGRDASCVQAP